MGTRKTIRQEKKVLKEIKATVKREKREERAERLEIMYNNLPVRIVNADISKASGSFVQIVGDIKATRSPIKLIDATFHTKNGIVILGRGGIKLRRRR